MVQKPYRFVGVLIKANDRRWFGSRIQAGDSLNILAVPNFYFEWHKARVAFLKLWSRLTFVSMSGFFDQKAVMAGRQFSHTNASIVIYRCWIFVSLAQIKASEEISRAKTNFSGGLD